MAWPCPSTYSREEMHRQKWELIQNSLKASKWLVSCFLFLGVYAWFFLGGGYQEGSAVGSSLSWGGVLSLMAGVSPEAHPLGPVLVALWSPRSTSCQSTAGCWVQLSASGTCCTGLVHSRGILVYILPHFLLYFLSVFYYKSGPCYAQSIFEVPYTRWKNK